MDIEDVLRCALMSENSFVRQAGSSYMSAQRVAFGNDVNWCARKTGSSADGCIMARERLRDLASCLVNLEATETKVMGDINSQSDRVAYETGDRARVVLSGEGEAKKTQNGEVLGRSGNHAHVARLVDGAVVEVHYTHLLDAIGADLTVNTEQKVSEQQYSNASGATTGVSADSITLDDFRVAETKRLASKHAKALYQAAQLGRKATQVPLFGVEAELFTNVTEISASARAGCSRFLAISYISANFDMPVVCFSDGGSQTSDVEAKLTIRIPMVKSWLTRNLEHTAGNTNSNSMPGRPQDLDSLDSKIHTKVSDDDIQSLFSLDSALLKPKLQEYNQKQLRYISKFFGISLKNLKCDLVSSTQGCIVGQSRKIEEDAFSAFFSVRIGDDVMPSTSIHNCSYVSTDTLLEYRELLHSRLADAAGFSLTLKNFDSVFRILAVLSQNPPRDIRIYTGRAKVLAPPKDSDSEIICLTESSASKVSNGQAIPKQSVIVEYNYDQVGVVSEEVSASKSDKIRPDLTPED